MTMGILSGWAFMALAFALAWRWGVRKKNAGIVDVVWAFSLGALVAWLALWAGGDPLRRALWAAAMGFWSLRLGFYLTARFRREGKEEGRYEALRAHWGATADGRFFWFFQAQAFANVILAGSLLPLLRNPAPLGIWDGLGLAVIAIAVFGERAADEQLEAWRSQPQNRGKTCRRGLWAYSRHPNYFFEWLHWLAYPIGALSLWQVGAGTWWWFTLLGPLAMMLFLLRATGIPYTEKQALKSRGEDYRRYQREVSAFIPWFSRKKQASS